MNTKIREEKVDLKEYSVEVEKQANIILEEILAKKECSLKDLLNYSTVISISLVLLKLHYEKNKTHKDNYLLLEDTLRRIDNEL